MEETMQFNIGVDACCTDSTCGTVTQVVIDPLARVVTHLVVEPEHRSGLGRLVPLDLVESAGDEVKLRCTKADFDRLDRAEETHFLPGTARSYGDYRANETALWPYYSLGDADPAGLGGVGLGMGNLSIPVVYDTLPAGDVQIRRGDPVLATDGHIGRVQGLVIDTASRHVTHILLQEGHLWGRKEVAIPIAAVVGAQEGIELNLTKDQIADLEPVEVGHPDR